MVCLLPSNERNLLGLCNWTQDVAVKDYNDFLERENSKINIHPKYEYYTNPDLLDKQSNGDTLLNRLVETLSKFDALGWKRSKHQVDFHKAFIGAILKKIYGNEIYANLPRLLKEYDMDELRPDVVVCTPRRYGKTTSVALFVAAVMIAIPGFKVDIYSTGRRASKKLLTLIFTMLRKFLGEGPWCKEFNQETLKICAPNSGGSESICNSYPSKVQINEQEQGNTYCHLNPVLFLFTFFR
jgi:hypothetical protein